MLLLVAWIRLGRRGFSTQRIVLKEQRLPAINSDISPPLNSVFIFVQMKICSQVLFFSQIRTENYMFFCHGL